MKKLIFGLLTLTALGVVSLPAIADEANVQGASQVITQDGDGNTSLQRTSQGIRTYNRGDADAKTNGGNVQDIYQDAMQEGVNNRARQENTQSIKTRREMRRGNSNIEVNQ